jgi:1,2-diacylglycerol 3-beta-glucosyltransferase
MLGAYVLRGVVLAGVGLRGFLDLLFAPAYIIWKLALNLRRKKNKGEWVRTAREGEKPS